MRGPHSYQTTWADSAMSPPRGRIDWNITTLVTPGEETTLGYSATFVRTASTGMPGHQ